MTEVVKSLRVASAQGTYPLPPVEQPGYMFAGRAVVVDSALLDDAANENERLRAALENINRRLSGGHYTFDELLSEAMFSVNLARAALNPRDSKDD